MKTTLVSFDLPAWRQRMKYTQLQAAKALGRSLAAYRGLEYRCADRAGTPCEKTIALLAVRLEQDEMLKRAAPMWKEAVK